jgi:hypothetical protein
MKPKIIILFSIGFLSASAQSLAADFPKSGEAEYDTYYVFENLMSIDGGAAIGAIDDFTGINARHGRRFADRCIKHVVDTVVDNTRAGLGGDPSQPHPLVKRNKNVMIARHDDAIASRRFEARPKPVLAALHQKPWRILHLAAHILNCFEHAGREILWRSVDGIEQLLSPIASDHLRAVAGKVVDSEHCYIIGRGLSYPTALEAALKIKEVSYIHAEGFAGGELKHGVIALIEDDTPCIVFTPLDETRDDILSGAMEMKSRGATIIGVSPENDEVFDVHIPVADVGDGSPIVNVVPAQLLGYQLALLRNLDPDKPRNLAKSVTVE